MERSLIPQAVRGDNYNANCIHISWIYSPQPLLEILLSKSGNQCCVVRGIVRFENETWILTTKYVNSWCYQIWLNDIDIFVAVHISLGFHKVSDSSKSYANLELKAWSTLANCGFTHAVARCYPSWRQRTWHLQSMTRTLLQKTTCHQFLYAVHHWTLAVHLPLAVTILLLVNYFRSVVRAFESTNSTMQNRLY